MKLQFSSWADFFAMGHHGAYVWSVVAITLVVLLALVWWPLKLHRDALLEQQRLDKIAKARQERSSQEYFQVTDKKSSI